MITSVLFAWMPSGDLACLQGSEHVCVQKMLYKHVSEYWWTIPAQCQSLAYSWNLVLVNMIIFSFYFSPLFLLFYHFILFLATTLTHFEKDSSVFWLGWRLLTSSFQKFIWTFEISFFILKLIEETFSA